MITWARVGQQCICILDSWRMPPDLPVHRVPMLNEVLTIRGVTPCGPYLSLRFEEIPETVRHGFWVTTYGWDVRYFRPLTKVTQADDVALVKSMLLDDPVQRLDFLLEDMGDR